MGSEGAKAYFIVGGAGFIGSHFCDALLARGAGTVVLTLGAQGALVRNARISEHVAAVDAGPVVRAVVG